MTLPGGSVDRDRDGAWHRLLRELGELALIERIRARLPPAPAFVIVGIGDDAAVVEPERNALEVLTTDCLVEGVHFDQAFVGAADIGHKALAVNLSDLAAMGAAPRVALLSLVLPPAWPVASVDALARRHGRAGRAQPAFPSSAATSPAPPGRSSSTSPSPDRCIARRVLTRAGARAGDELYVTGTLGGAAAGLRAAARLRGFATPARRALPMTVDHAVSPAGATHALRADARPQPRGARVRRSQRRAGRRRPAESGMPAGSAPSSTPTRCPSRRARRCAMRSVEAKITSSCLRYRPECGRG